MQRLQKKYPFLAIIILLTQCKGPKEELVLNKTQRNWSNIPPPISYTAQTEYLQSNHIPDSVFSMQGLTLLAVTGMDCDYGDTLHCYMIKEIPDQIRRLSQLKTLILNVNAITELPPAMNELKQLSLLDLSDNPGLNNIDALRDLPALQNLLLYGCSIRHLPKQLKHFKNLQLIGLTGNPVAKEDLRWLRKALPNCRVVI